MSVIDPVVRNGLPQITERLTVFPQMETVLQELSTGIKIIDSYDDEVVCLSHINEENQQQEDHTLSVTSIRLMQKLKDRTSIDDIPMTLINMLDAARLASESFKNAKKQRAEWLSLFRSPSSTHTKKCSECSKEKLQVYSIPYLLELAQNTSISKSFYKERNQNSARNALIPAPKVFQDISYEAEITTTGSCRSIINKISIRTERNSNCAIPVHKREPSVDPQRRMDLVSMEMSQNDGTNSQEYRNTLSREIKSETKSVTRSIQRSSAKVSTSGIYPTTTCCSSSKNEGLAYTNEDLQTAVIEYVTSQQSGAPDQLIKLERLQIVACNVKGEIDNPIQMLSRYFFPHLSSKENGAAPPVKVDSPRCTRKRIESVSVSSKTVVYEAKTPANTYKEKSTVDTYLVRRQTVPSKSDNAKQSSLKSNEHTRYKVRSRTTFVKEQPGMKYTSESKYEEHATNKRKSYKPIKKHNDIDESPKLLIRSRTSSTPTSKSNSHVPNQHEDPKRTLQTGTRLVKVKRAEIPPNDEHTQRRKERRPTSYQPLMPTSEPITRAKAHMYPTNREPVRRTREKYDDEFDLTSRDCVKKFVKHINKNDQ